MLFMASIELGLVARNFSLHPHCERRRRQDFVVLLVTAAALVGFSHDGLGFLLGMVTALVFWLHRHLNANAAHPDALLPTRATGSTDYAASHVSAKSGSRPESGSDDFAPGRAAVVGSGPGSNSIDSAPDPRTVAAHAAM
ncbi:hypothetical protein IW136_005017 [Coemansia sp. RSA 678]|nr:hypothetical protein IW136_005017 [Coemansia sp. RSA 678]